MRIRKLKNEKGKKHYNYIQFIGLIPIKGTGFFPTTNEFMKVRQTDNK